MNDTFKRHLISAGITFLTVFAVSVGFQLSSGAVTPENIGGGVAISIVFTAARAGVKALAEILGLTGDFAN